MHWHRQNLALIQDILDDIFPNWGQAWETSTHLNRCPNNGCTLLFKESVTNLSTWIHQHNCTDPELSYWIEKYLLFRGTRTITSLVDEGGFCSKDLCLAAAGQDLLGWTEFLHGKVSVKFATIQHIRCMLSPSCWIMRDDWMRVFISQLIQISHSQWIFQNYTLHNKQRGYLRLWECSEVLQEVHKLLDTAPANIPKQSQYLLELDHSTLYNASYERQAYCILAMQAACRAGRQTAV